MSEEKKPTEDLSEEQLETVAGGLNFTAPTPYLKVELESVLVSSLVQSPGTDHKKL
jgi:hypothetical protein